MAEKQIHRRGAKVRRGRDGNQDTTRDQAGPAKRIEPPGGQDRCRTWWSLSTVSQNSDASVATEDQVILPGVIRSRQGAWTLARDGTTGSQRHRIVPPGRGAGHGSVRPDRRPIRGETRPRVTSGGFTAGCGVSTFSPEI